MLLRSAYRAAALIKSLSAERLTMDEHFLAAVRLASEGLYDEVFKLQTARRPFPDNIKAALEKYAARMSTRATPFGAFAGVSLVSCGASEEGLVIQAEPYRLHVSPDFAELRFLYREYVNQCRSKVLFLANPSAYLAGGQIRYVYAETDEHEKLKFSIRSINNGPAVMRLLSYCREEKILAEIKGITTALLEMAPEDAGGFVGQLAELQLLLPAASPNVTGEDAWQRLKGLLSAQAPYPGLPPVMGRRELAALPNAGHTSLKSPGKPLPLYANLELAVSGNLPLATIPMLEDANRALQRLSASPEPEALVQFKKAFADKFGTRPVPLMMALDPELGIAYDGLGSPRCPQPLLDGLVLGKQFGRDARPEWTAIHRLLMRKWPGTAGGLLELTDADLSELPSPAAPLPPSWSVLFSLSGGQMEVIEAGGASAAALPGRFTSFSKAIYQHCGAIAKIEADNNPEVIFAEIAFSGEGHVDNINRRQHIYAYEIPVLTASCLPAGQQIHLSGLYLSVQDGKLLLWSEKLGKRLIPRLSSAYNFRRSGLSVIRLLGDLQYQSVHHTFNLNLRALFPGLPYYPRVVYKNCILSAACWIFDKPTLEEIFSLPAGLQQERFRGLAKAAGMPHRLLLADGDKRLPVNALVEREIILLLQELKGREEAVFKESMAEPGYDGIVTDESGATFVHELVAAAVNKQASYPMKYSKPLLTRSGTGSHIFLPGGEWLYYKAYCQSFNSDETLLSISSALAHLEKRGEIRRWFFIRYFDPQPHLRVRINVQAAFLGSTMVELEKAFRRLLSKGKIQSVQLDSYEQESDRYGSSHMALVEAFFCESSLFVLAFLRKNRQSGTPKPHYTVALASVYRIMAYLVPEDVARLRLLTEIQGNLFLEFGGSKTLKIGLADKKRALREEVGHLLNEEHLFRHYKLMRPWERLLLTLARVKQTQKQLQPKLVADLIHMHVNRFFAADMREQELVIYTLMLQYEQTKQKRQNR